MGCRPPTPLPWGHRPPHCVTPLLWGHRTPQLPHYPGGTDPPHYPRGADPPQLPHYPRTQTPHQYPRGAGHPPLPITIGMQTPPLLPHYHRDADPPLLPHYHGVPPPQTGCRGCPPRPKLCHRAVCCLLLRGGSLLPHRGLWDPPCPTLHPQVSPTPRSSPSGAACAVCSCPQQVFGAVTGTGKDGCLENPLVALVFVWTPHLLPLVSEYRF